MAALIGSLRVALGLDTAQFANGLKKASSGLDGFAKAAAVGLAAVGAAATGAFLAIRSAADRADDAFKASQSLGIPIKDLGRLSYAAEMSGASFEVLSTGVRKATQAIATSVSGASNDATKALKQLGVATTAGGGARSASAVIEDVAEAFSKMPDGVEKTNAAIAIFGRSGAALIPTLNMGREGLRAMGDEAERMGLVFSEDTAAAAEAFNDNLMRLDLSMTGLWNRVLAGVIPAFAGLSNKIVAISQNGQVLDAIVGGITVAMNLLTKGIGYVADNFQFLTDLFKVFVAAKLITFVASIAGGFITFAKTIRVAGLAMALVTSITRAKIIAIALLAGVIAKLTNTYDALVAGLESVGKAMMDALPPSVREGIDGFTEGLFSLGDQIDSTNAKATESMATYLRIGNEAPGAFGKVTKAVTDVGQAIGETFADMGETISGSISSGLSGFVKDAIAGGDAIGNLANKVSDLGGQLIDMAFNQAIQGLFGMLGGVLGFGNSTGGILNNILAGGPVRPGFNLPGFANGGSGFVGGSGGVDSQLFMAKATPGEPFAFGDDAINGMGGRATPVLNVKIDARGAQVGVAEQIDHWARIKLPGLVQKAVNDPYAVGG